MAFGIFRSIKDFGDLVNSEVFLNLALGSSYAEQSLQAWFAVAHKLSPAI